MSRRILVIDDDSGVRAATAEERREPAAVEA